MAKHSLITGSQFSDLLAISLGLFAAVGAGCEQRSRKIDGAPDARPSIRVLIENAPASLNPRTTLDAIGQRLEPFVFRALTRIEADLEPKGDLASGWSTRDAGKTYVFPIRSEQRDHRGEPITAQRLRTCIENYLMGEPKSPHRAAFPHFLSIEAESTSVVVRLSTPDPYLPKNLSVLRYFSFVGDPEHPCREPKPGDVWVQNGDYEARPYPTRMEEELRLHAKDPKAPDLIFRVARDETSRLFKLMNGEADVALNSFAPTKTQWIATHLKSDFNFVERNGTMAGYLAFNLRDPVLAKQKVREAIAHAIDRERIVRTKIRGNAELASSFLVSSLPEAISPRPFKYDPALSEKLLEESGYPRDRDGVRLQLRYKSSTNKTGLELAQIYREMLAQVGVQIELEVVEPSVFFSSIRKGNFQLYMSQWVGVSDGSIYLRTLRSGNPDNRVHYENPEMDSWIDASQRELDFTKRKALLALIQEKMLADLPYFPLWHWTNGLVVRSTIAPPKPSELSLAGSYAPFADLRFLK